MPPTSKLKLVNRTHNLVLPESQTSTPPPDPYELTLRVFSDKICADALQNPTHVGLAQARLMVLDRFLELYSASAKLHHRHLFGGFMSVMSTLREAQLRIAPPQLYIPPPPPPPVVVPPPQIAGVFIGELEDE